MAKTVNINVRVTEITIVTIDEIARQLGFVTGGRSKVVDLALQDFFDIFQLWNGRITETDPKTLPDRK